jgi:hypothetical protein
MDMLSTTIGIVIGGGILTILAIVLWRAPRPPVKTEPHMDRRDQRELNRVNKRAESSRHGSDGRGGG